VRVKYRLDCLEISDSMLAILLAFRVRLLFISPSPLQSVIEENSKSFAEQFYLSSRY
jgi:hypothetical protein